MFICVYTRCELGLQTSRSRAPRAMDERAMDEESVGVGPTGGALLSDELGRNAVDVSKKRRVNQKFKGQFLPKNLSFVLLRFPCRPQLDLLQQPS